MISSSSLCEIKDRIHHNEESKRMIFVPQILGEIM